MRECVARAATTDMTHSQPPYPLCRDLYIGSDAVPATRRPNSTRAGHIWESTSFGVETIVVSPGEYGYCAVAPCSYYLAVYGYSNATFRIMARSHSAAPTPLVVSLAARSANIDTEYECFVILPPLSSMESRLPVKSLLVSGVRKWAGKV